MGINGGCGRMFDERMALKIRLEQMADSEERILREFRQEREMIFKRLRELDQAEKQTAHYVVSTDIEANEQVRKTTVRNRSERTALLRETALEVLKESEGPLKGADLKREVEQRTNEKIANMTTFMRALEKMHPEVKKVDRGTYTIVDEAHTL